jgi:hypothetical protein
MGKVLREEGTDGLLTGGGRKAEEFVFLLLPPHVDTVRPRCCALLRVLRGVLRIRITRDAAWPQSSSRAFRSVRERPVGTTDGKHYLAFAGAFDSNRERPAS